MSTAALRTWRRRGAGALFAVVLVLEVLAMGAAGLAKFQSMDGWFYWFARFGYPPRFALLVGAVEFTAAGLLLIPRLATYAAVVLSVVMVGALHATLTTETDLSWFDPVLHLAFLAVIGTVRWNRRWKPGVEPAAG